MIENEVFTEAVPSTIIMTFLLAVLGLFREDSEVLVGNINGSGSYGVYLFLVTFASSAVSAGLGLAKSLKVRSFPVPERDHAEILMDTNFLDPLILS